MGCSSTQVQRLFYIDSRFRTLRGQFRQLRTALRRRSPGSLLLLVDGLHRGENANNNSIFIRYAPLTSLIDAEETKEKLPLYSKFLSMMSDSYATELRLSKKSSASNTVEKVTQYLQSH